MCIAYEVADSETNRQVDKETEKRITSSRQVADNETDRWTKKQTNEPALAGKANLHMWVFLEDNM